MTPNIGTGNGCVMCHVLKDAREPQQANLREDPRGLASQGVAEASPPSYLVAAKRTRSRWLLA